MLWIPILFMKTSQDIKFVSKWGKTFRPENCLLALKQLACWHHTQFKVWYKKFHNCIVFLSVFSIYYGCCLTSVLLLCDSRIVCCVMQINPLILELLVLLGNQMLPRKSWSGYSTGVRIASSYLRNSGVCMDITVVTLDSDWKCIQIGHMVSWKK
jgi:hypothetical protein